jgi:hypothetical protein
MEASVKEYLYLEKEIESYEDRLLMYSRNSPLFDSQISMIEEKIWQLKNEFQEVLNQLSSKNVKSDQVRLYLIRTIENILENIRQIKTEGKYPSLQQGLCLKAQIFWSILYKLQHTIQDEGKFGPYSSRLQPDYYKWDSKGLEDILDNARILLSVSRFSSMREAIDFFTDLAQKFIAEHVNVVDKYYDVFGNRI